MLLLGPEKDYRPKTDQKMLVLLKYFSGVEENEVGDIRGKIVKMTKHIVKFTVQVYYLKKFCNVFLKDPILFRRRKVGRLEIRNNAAKLLLMKYQLFGKFKCRLFL
jgi:hypothetical protein